MSQPMRRRRALATIAELDRAATNVFVVHYSCETFYERTEPSSPRVTSIAARNLGSGQTESFSIHQMAERKQVDLGDLEQRYDELEAQMLGEFSEFIERRPHARWLHWNMRDINYGFPALAHRAKALGRTMVSIPEAHLTDLSPLLIEIYGPSYIGHPRLQNLIGKNEITSKDFLTGAQEGAAFEAREYVKLHQSTLRKVEVISNIFYGALRGSLRTDSRWRERYGGVLPAAGEIVREHWWFSLFAFSSAVLGIVSFFLDWWRSPVQ